MATITKSLPVGPTTEEQISKFEKHIGHRLPSGYRNFLLEHNGGKPEPDAFKMNLWGEEEEDVGGDRGLRISDWKARGRGSAEPSAAAATTVRNPRSEIRSPKSGIQEP